MWYKSERYILGDFRFYKSLKKNPHVNLWQFILDPYGKVHLAWTFFSDPDEAAIDLVL